MTRRRCGSRQAGGVYLEVPLSKYGLPLEDFLCDPAIRIPDELELSTRGMILRTHEDGSQILYDWVGANNYPNVLDFVEEIRHLGLSRRIQSNFDFSQLNGKTKYCAVHPRGYVANESWYRQYAQENPLVGEFGAKFETPWPCPRGIHPIDHTEDFPCSGVWWHDIGPGHGTPTEKTRVVTVDQPSGDPYIAMRRPLALLPVYYPAIVMVLPVVKLSVIKGPDGEHEKPLEQASKVGNGVKVSLEDA
jgi:hypothetical protein